MSGFRVPEAGRVTDGPMGSAPGAGNYGAFLIPSPEPGWQLALIADDGQGPADEGGATGWQHVSVRALRRDQSRVPTWKEMCHVKDVCWDAEAVVVQYHPAKSRYVNRHEHVLHLWAPTEAVLPVPPLVLV